VRFLARRVYLGVAVAIATVVARGPDYGAIRLLSRELGVSRATVARWGHWWRELVGSAFWQRVRGALPPNLEIAGLPGSLLDWFSGDRVERLLCLLRLLRPITGGFPVTLARCR
jgi:hypothetical protein